VFFVLIFTSDLAFADLNGNLDYIVKTDDGLVRLIITNKFPDNPVYLSEVTMVFPDKKSLPVAIPFGQPIFQGYIVELGNVSTLARYVAPRVNMSALNSVIYSDSNCSPPCDIIHFTLQINVLYGDGISQKNHTFVYLHLLS
jgi:hypothetical protein